MNVSFCKRVRALAINVKRLGLFKNLETKLFRKKRLARLHEVEVRRWH